MKNEQKQTGEEPKNQKHSESLSEAELDNIAGGGGPAVATGPGIVDLVNHLALPHKLGPTPDPLPTKPIHP